jgi:23S rRNA pseudouridine1911/1915/1917 synthase
MSNISKNQHIFTVSEAGAGLRLDKFLTTCLPELSRARIQALLAENCVTCDGKVTIDASAKTKISQKYQIIIPEIKPSHILPQAMELDIVFEDKHLLVINKPAGLTVHPAVGNHDNTLVNALLAHCGDSLSGIGGVARPGIVHRLDKDTSGLMVVAKHDTAHNFLAAQLADHTLGRTYNAIVWGVPNPPRGTITGNIGRSPSNRQKMAVVKTGGKPAVTHYSILLTLNTIATLVECRLETGRTHQIRVHLTNLGNPLIGDPYYGQTTTSRLKQNIYKHLPDEIRTAIMGFNRQALHAKELRFIHPHSKKEMQFTSKLPSDMKRLLDVLSSRA